MSELPPPPPGFRREGKCLVNEETGREMADFSQLKTVPVRSRAGGGAMVLTAEYAEDREWLAEKYRTPGGNPYLPVPFMIGPLLDAGYHL